MFVRVARGCEWLVRASQIRRRCRARLGPTSSQVGMATLALLRWPRLTFSRMQMTGRTSCIARMMLISWPPRRRQLPAMNPGHPRPLLPATMTTSSDLVQRMMAATLRGILQPMRPATARCVLQLRWSWPSQLVHAVPGALNLVRGVAICTQCDVPMYMIHHTSRVCSYRPAKAPSIAIAAPGVAIDSGRAASPCVPRQSASNAGQAAAGGFRGGHGSATRKATAHEPWRGWTRHSSTRVASACIQGAASAEQPKQCTTRSVQQGACTFARCGRLRGRVLRATDFAAPGVATCERPRPASQEERAPQRQARIGACVVCCSSDPCLWRLRAWFSGAPAARFSSLAKFRKPVSGRATLASQLRAISMPHARATALSAAEVAALEEVEHQSVGSFSDEDAPMPPTPVDAGAGAAAGAHASGGGSGASAWLRDLASAVVPGTWCVG